MKTWIVIDGTYQVTTDWHANKINRTRLRSRIELLRSKYEAEHVVACWDVPGPTFRHELFPDYKADREKNDPQLVEALEDAQVMCETIGVPNISQKDYEADDCIATIVSWAKELGNQTIILSRDSDLNQLLSLIHI